jgi:hypothetical protein
MKHVASREPTRVLAVVRSDLAAAGAAGWENPTQRGGTAMAAQPDQLAPEFVWLLRE